MRELSNLKKFFIICGIVCVVGLVCAIVGGTAGGVDGFDKVAEKYDWVSGDAGERGVTEYPVEDFDSVSVTGDGDVWLIGTEFYKNASRLAQDDLLTAGEMDLIGKNKVLVIAGDKVPQPEISVTDGVLNINCGNLEEQNGINLNFSGASWTPEILICCPREPLESLAMSADYSDLTCLGTGWKNAKLEMNSSYIAMEGVESGGLQIDLESGDCELEGEFMKTTSVKTESGDVQIDTSLPKAEYGLSLKSESGDIELIKPGGDMQEADEMEDGDDGEYVEEVQVNGGPHIISVETESGDVKVRFGAGE